MPYELTLLVSTVLVLYLRFQVLAFSGAPTLHCILDVIVMFTVQWHGLVVPVLLYIRR